MYSVVRIFDGEESFASSIPQVVRDRVGALGEVAGFVTLLAIRGDDGAVVTVEIFETLEDLRAAWDRHGASETSHNGTRTISGEIVFQRGL